MKILGVAILNCMLFITFPYVPISVPLIPFRACFSFFSPFLYTHWILHLLDFSTLYALPHRFTTFSCPLPLSSYKEKTCGKGVRLPENKENQKKDLYCLSFLYLLFQVSNRMKIIETKDLFSLFSLFSFWGSRKIKKKDMFFLYFLYFLFKAPGK